MSPCDTFWEEVAVYVLVLLAAVAPAIALWVMP